MLLDPGMGTAAPSEGLSMGGPQRRQLPPMHRPPLWPSKAQRVPDVPSGRRGTVEPYQLLTISQGWLSKWLDTTALREAKVPIEVLL
jgi:hypothetical protein